MKDAIVEEIRKIRHQIENECNNNPDELVKRILEKQKSNSKKLVTRKPKLLKSNKVAQNNH